MGREQEVEPWVERYRKRLIERPPKVEHIDALNWPEVLGEVDRSTDWEDFFAAEPLRAAGAYEAYVAALASALVKRPDHPATLYNLACAEALAGRADDALAHLRRALELKPEWAEMAQKDDDFSSVRDAPDWPA